MLWKVRASSPDRPGGLAALAQRCAEADVDIRGMQVFPGVDEVTDEVVVDVARLLGRGRRGGARRVGRVAPRPLHAVHR